MMDMMEESVTEVANTAVTTSSDPITRAGLDVDVREMVINRWTPERIFKHLRDQFQITVPVSVIAAHITAVPEIDKLPEIGLDKRYKSEVRIDPVQEMQRLLREQGARVEAVLTCEDITPGASKQLSGVVGQEIKNYFDMLKEFISIAQSLGVLSKRPEEILATLRSQNPTLEELRNARMGQLLEQEARERNEPVLEVGAANGTSPGDDSEEGSGPRIGDGELGIEAEGAVPGS